MVALAGNKPPLNEIMLRILSEDHSYLGTHNALLDAVDELTIMRLLGQPIEKYIKL